MRWLGGGDTTGERPSEYSDDVRHLPHKASRVLEYLRARGVPVLTSTPPWTTQRKQDAMERGPHQSSQGEREFVATELLDFCKQGYWLVLPFECVSEWPQLRISPLGVVLQHDRRPRLIVDYTFSSVNAETVPMAPREAMQFGRALQRILRKIVTFNPSMGPSRWRKSTSPTDSTESGHA